MNCCWKFPLSLDILEPCQNYTNQQTAKESGQRSPTKPAQNTIGEQHLQPKRCRCLFWRRKRTGKHFLCASDFPACDSAGTASQFLCILFLFLSQTLIWPLLLRFHVSPHPAEPEAFGVRDGKQPTEQTRQENQPEEEQAAFCLPEHQKQNACAKQNRLLPTLRNTVIEE